jgi:aspartate/methionine/tyrosine aminotransferase
MYIDHFVLYRYISNIEMAGGKVVYVPLRPPPNAQTSSAADWTIDMNEVKKAITHRTKMIVSCSHIAYCAPRCN